MAPKRGRSRLHADIEAASLNAGSDIRKVAKTNDEDEFGFTFVHPQLPRGEIGIHVMPQDTAGYPGDHYFLVVTNDEVPPSIGKILEDAIIFTTGMHVADLIKTLAQKLCDSLNMTEAGEGDDDSSSVDATNMDGDLSELAGSDLDLSFDYGGISSPRPDSQVQNTAMIEPHAPVLQRVRQDFRAVRDAGFRVGKLLANDGITRESIMAVSIRVSKLGLSEKTQTAWGFQSSDYIVLLMKYVTGAYSSFEDIMSKSCENTQLEFRLRKATKYRPTLEEAKLAFESFTGVAETAGAPSFNEFDQNTARVEDSTVVRRECSTFGVGSSVERFLDECFIPMAKLRKAEHISWDDAFEMHLQSVRRGWGDHTTNGPTVRDHKSVLFEHDTTDPKPLASILTDDHISSQGPISLPLIAMQFAMHYLVKCTSYCMICHEKVSDKFDALKPYVCGKPLCLFQYMSLGLGPSTDQEIINQQYVVDLLISFCYSSLQLDSHGTPKTGDLPMGLDLQVPCVRSPKFYTMQPCDAQVGSYGILVDPISLALSWADREAKLTNPSQPGCQGLRGGQWVLIHTQLKLLNVEASQTHGGDYRKGESSVRDTVVEFLSEGMPKSLRESLYEYSTTGARNTVDVFHHARIESICGSTIKLHFVSRHPVPSDPNSSQEVKCHDWNTGVISGQMVTYNQTLDDIETKAEKAFSMSLLLDSLPSVREMRSYLLSGPSRNLATWNHISPGARKLLRWIIASNRSYIVQIDDDSRSDLISAEGGNRSREKILGVDGWLQFRFAQGSPETEMRFQEAVKQVNKPSRTLLAWHGSPIQNWHSIIRNGLNFNEVAHGRAHGNGVYFSRMFDYSLAYSSPHHYVPVVPTWPNSSLNITTAISLNELVNKPHKFKYSGLCYVVDKLHWIQCRYLFVLACNTPKYRVPCQRSRPPWPGDVSELRQEAENAILGPNGAAVFIPKIAFDSAPEPNKDGPNSSENDKREDTDDEDAEDIDFLARDDAVVLRAVPQELQTDFRPDGLDFSKLPQMPQPSYATKPAQQTIQRELQKIEKVQSATPLHELGWYVHVDKLDNMFQWIAELHSFDPNLPLAKDMKAAGITSIVLEIRFMRGFPMTPPFVRVIQPRFLPFALGGGGHVTAGGAICLELLTNTGWSPANSIESVLLQVRIAISSLDPRPARLDTSPSHDRPYNIREAVDAYMRAAATHGWEVPAELKESVLMG